MAGDSEDPEAAADRLEAALERIVQAATRQQPPPSEPSSPIEAQELSARLDNLIDRLRTALGARPG
jgi:hypothetical protein